MNFHVCLQSNSLNETVATYCTNTWLFTCKINGTIKKCLNFPNFYVFTSMRHDMIFQNLSLGKGSLAMWTDVWSMISMMNSYMSIDCA